jgi:lipoprotein-anchoring transpeptidase ErfK/SrfK
MLKYCTRMLLVVLILCLYLGQSAEAGYKIEIDKSVNQLTLYKDDTIVNVFPVATGKEPSLTPEGIFSITVKIVNPYYGKLKIPGGSPKNPLGYRWLGLNLGGGGEYGIHGTNNPSSIGKYASAGCIRMNNEDVSWLFDTIPVGTPVEIYNTSLPAFRIDPGLPEYIKSAIKNGMVIPP